MERFAPSKRFVAASSDAVCPYMKRITLDKVASALERMEPRVTVAPEVAVRARRAIDRMLAVSG